MRELPTCIVQWALNTLNNSLLSDVSTKSAQQAINTAGSECGVWRRWLCGFRVICRRTACIRRNGHEAATKPIIRRNNPPRGQGRRWPDMPAHDGRRIHAGPAPEASAQHGSDVHTTNSPSPVSVAAARTDPCYYILVTVTMRGSRRRVNPRRFRCRGNRASARLV